jgi:hypothetical protein
MGLSEQRFGCAEPLLRELPRRGAAPLTSFFGWCWREAANTTQALQTCTDEYTIEVTCNSRKI